MRRPIQQVILSLLLLWVGCGLLRGQVVTVDNIGDCSLSQGIPVFDPVSGYYKCSPIVNTNSDTRLISGGAVSYSGAGLVYDVQAATYTIAGNLYSSPQAQVTLDAADGSNPRIDLIVFTTSSVADKVAGTAATPAVAPSIDPTTTLYSGVFAYVNTSALVPTNVSLTNIYLENTEWTCAETSATGTIDCASTNNPYAGTKDIEFTAVGPGDFVTLTNAAAIGIPNTTRLSLFIRSKAKWNGQRSITIQFLNSTTPVGNAVTFNEGAYGFNSSTTGSYQLIVIPIANFALTGPVDVLKWTISGGGGSTIGFYLDNITLQSDPGTVTSTPGNTPSMTQKRTNYYMGAGTTGQYLGDAPTCAGCVGGDVVSTTNPLGNFIFQTADSNNAHSEMDGQQFYITQQNPIGEFLYRHQALTATRWWVGLFDGSCAVATVALAADPAGCYIVAFRYDSTIDGNIYAVVKDGTTINAVSTGIAAATTPVRVKFRVLGASSVEFYVNDVLTNVLTANLPTATTAMQLFIVITQLAGSGGPKRVNWYIGTITMDTY